MPLAAFIVPLSMIAISLSVAWPARAADGPAFAAMNPALDHRHQVGLSVMPGLGYRIIVPYEEHKDCVDSSGDPGKRVCTNRTAVFTDFQLSFGITRRLDLMVDLRFALGEDPVTQNHPFAVAPGVRIWLDPDDNVKFFTTLQMVYDSAEYSNVPDSDFGVRNANGLMYDVIRNVGFYLQFGETVGFRRWFRIELDAGLGVQARFP